MKYLLSMLFVMYIFLVDHVIEVELFKTRMSSKVKTLKCDFSRGNSFLDFTFKRTQKLLLLSFAGVSSGVLVERESKVLLCDYQLPVKIVIRQALLVIEQGRVSNKVQSPGIF